MTEANSILREGGERPIQPPKSPRKSCCQLREKRQERVGGSEFKKLVRLDPGNFDLNHNFGEFYVKLGQLSNAIPLLQAAQHLKPADYTNELRLGAWPDDVGQTG